MVFHLILFLSLICLGSVGRTARPPPKVKCSRLWREAAPKPRISLSPKSELSHPYLYRVEGHQQKSFVFVYFPYLLSKHHVPSPIQQMIFDADEVFVDLILTTPERPGRWFEKYNRPAQIPSGVLQRTRKHLARLEKMRPLLARESREQSGLPFSNLSDAAEFLPAEYLYDLLHLALLNRSYPRLDIRDSKRYVEQVLYSLELHQMVQRRFHEPLVRISGLSAGISTAIGDVWEYYVSAELLVAYLEWTKSSDHLDRSWIYYWQGLEPLDDENPFEMLSDWPPTVIHAELSQQLKRLIVDEIFWNFLDQEYQSKRKIFLVSAPTFFGTQGLRRALEVGGFRVKRFAP